MKSQMTAGVCRERRKGTTSMVHLLVQESSERGQVDWRLKQEGTLGDRNGGPKGGST